MSFCSLIKGIKPKIRKLCFVLINSVILNPFCVWIKQAIITLQYNVTMPQNKLPEKKKKKTSLVLAVVFFFLPRLKTVLNKFSVCQFSKACLLSFVLWTCCPLYFGPVVLCALDLLSFVLWTSGDRCQCLQNMPHETATQHKRALLRRHCRRWPQLSI